MTPKISPIEVQDIHHTNGNFDLVNKINELVSAHNASLTSREEKGELDNACQVSGLYGKDNNKNLHFYCEFCDEEMGYNEKRICKSKVQPQPPKTDELTEEVENLSRKIHEWYLESTKVLHPESYNPNAQKSYDDLTEEQKEMDRYMARKVLSLLSEQKREMREAVSILKHEGYYHYARNKENGEIYISMNDVLNLLK